MAAYAALTFLSLLWGSSFLLIKVAARVFDPFSFALARVSVAAAAMLAASMIGRQQWPGWRPTLWAKLAALAWIGQVVPFLLLGVAASMSASSDMALMMGASPIFVFLVGRFLGSGDRWTLVGALGLALGFAGIGLALWAPGAHGATLPHAAAGRAFALAAACFYGLGAILSAAATREIGAVRSVTASMTISALTLALLSPLFGAGDLAGRLASAPGPLAAMVALGIFNTALAYYVYFQLVAEEGPTFASLNNYVVPLIGVVGGALALGEPIALASWGGIALVLIGVALTGHALRVG